MTDWSRLEHAYGSAEDIPELLAKLSPTSKAEAWSELWSCVCHQGTVYSASLPILSELLKIASGWDPQFRDLPLALASSIVVAASTERPDELNRYREVISDLHALTIETFRPGLNEKDFTELLQSAISFAGDYFWGEYLDRLSWGEFEVDCPQCSGHLWMVIGENGFFATSEEWVGDLSVFRKPIHPCSQERLEGSSSWIFEQCKKYGYEERAHWFRYLFGQVVCPHCGENISVAEAIKNGY